MGYKATRLQGYRAIRATRATWATLATRLLGYRATRVTGQIFILTLYLCMKHLLFQESNKELQG